MEPVTNIYCVGKNYAEHAKELNTEVPEEPLFFMKPTHALFLIDEASTVAFPDSLGEVHYEIELVVQLKNDYDPHAPLEASIGTTHLGIDFTLRQLQNELRQKGLPWFASKGFKQSAALSKAVPFVSETAFNQHRFALAINGKTVQEASPSLMVYPLRELCDYCHMHFGLKKGDILYTGTPAGVGRVHKQDVLSLTLDNETIGNITILS